MFDSLDFTTLIIIFVVLAISITVHEAMHAFTSFWLGDDTAEREGRISLNPLRHIDPVMTLLLPMVTLILFQVPLLAAKPVPFRPDRVKWDEFGAALVGIAGPLTNLFMAVVAAVFINLFQGSLSLPVLDVAMIFVAINIGLFIFNMLPIPPLDGSRLLYAFAPEPVQRFMASLEQFGIFIIFGLIVMVPAFGQVISNLNSALFNLLF